MSRPKQNLISAEALKMVSGIASLLKQFPETKHCTREELQQLERLTEARQLLNKVAATAAEGGGKR